MKNTEFDNFAENYNDVHEKSVKEVSGADRDYFSEYKIVEVKDYLCGKSILDFGCGDGNTACFIQKLCTGYTYTGIDVSKESIRVAKERELPSCSFYDYDGSTIPFADETFDVVFASCVFHHIEPQNRLDSLKEIYRVLKQGGKVIIFEHNPLNPLTVKVVHDCPFDKGVKLEFHSQLKKKLKKALFRNVKTSFTIFMPRRSFFLKLLWIEKYLKKCIGGGNTIA